MANETRPRREPSPTSRIRKAAMPAPASPAPDDAATGHAPSASNAEPQETPTGVAPGADYRERDRVEREPYREDRPADREPIRFRDREPVRDRTEREAGLPVRERLSRVR